MMISVVIAAYNEEKTLGPCLDCLLAQTAPGNSYEIIVADDGSTDQTRAVAESRSAKAEARSTCIRVVTQTNQGPGAARNLGARSAHGEVLLFVDADSIPDSHLVERMAAVFLDPTLAGASGEKKTNQTNLWARYVQIEYDFKYERLASRPAIDFVDSSTAGYRREVLLSNGGFDTSLKEAEDTEFSFRLAGRGYRMVLVPDAITYHTHPESLAHYLERKFQYARWRAVVYARYPRKAASDQRTPFTQKLQPVLAYAFVPAVFGTFIWHELAWGILGLALFFIATTGNQAAYCWRRSRVVGLLVPMVVWLSAYMSGAGAAVGLVASRRR